MSALDFQKVMAQLIRYPGDSLEQIYGRVGGLELSERETARLEQMENDPLVRKFGRKMSYCRRRDAVQVMRVSQGLIPDAVLDHMYYDLFETARSSTDFVMLGVQFLEFLLSDERCAVALRQCPPFVRDCLVYDRARAFVVRQMLRVPDPSLPENSLLAHGAFVIAELEYDVPTFDRMKLKDPQAKTEPTRLSKTLLFSRTASRPFYRMFEIDQSIAAFLAMQRSNPSLFTGELPAAFPAMVKVGLCRDSALV